MKLFACLLMLAVFGLQDAYSQKFARTQSFVLESKKLGQSRTVFVYTPPFYDEAPVNYYDVIYVFDAQNREFFDMTHAALSFVSGGLKRFIVVGITSPQMPEIDYGRNNDMLPSPVNEDPATYYNGYHGNAGNFLGFVREEVMPYVEKNFRTTRNRRLSVGHSLSASLLLYDLFEGSGMFDVIIAVSPNFAYDKDFLADKFINYDFGKIDYPKFIYLSNGSEGISSWREWKPAREKVYRFIEGYKGDKVTFVVDEFPDQEHWAVFPSGVINGLKAYVEYERDAPAKLSKELHKVTITIKGTDKNDDIYITGNQAELGMWQADKVKMERISDLERQITLWVHLPAEVKFTRGSWNTVGQLKNSDYMNNIFIDPAQTGSSSFEFEIEAWSDRWQ